MREINWGQSNNYKGELDMRVRVFRIILFVIALVPIQSWAAVTCNGTIEAIYKWNFMDRVSIMLEGTTRWIRMPTDIDESMALMAFAAEKPVSIYWSATDVTSCVDGWSHNRSLEGYWVISK